MKERGKERRNGRGRWKKGKKKEAEGVREGWRMGGYEGEASGSLNPTAISSLGLEPQPGVPQLYAPEEAADKVGIRS